MSTAAFCSQYLKQSFVRFNITRLFKFFQKLAGPIIYGGSYQDNEIRLI